MDLEREDGSGRQILDDRGLRTGNEFFTVGLHVMRELHIHSYRDVQQLVFVRDRGFALRESRWILDLE